MTFFQFGIFKWGRNWNTRRINKIYLCLGTLNSIKSIGDRVRNGAALVVTAEEEVEVLTFLGLAAEMIRVGPKSRKES